jgi:hypothetical protein
MKQSELKSILEQMKILEGKKLYSITRLGATGNICFVSNDNKEFFLRVQTAFRVRAAEKILTANLEMFEPTQALEESPSFDWETFNWDVQGFNCYDEWTKKYNKDKEHQAVVENIIVNDFGDLTINCSNNISIDVFVNAATKECWRFFEKNAKDDHLVITGQGVA